MTTSPIQTQTFYDIVREAALVLGVTDRERPLTADIRQAGFNALNNLVKSLQVNYHLWANTEAILFLNANQTEYLLGPSGDHVTDVTDFRNYTTDSSSSGTNLNVTGNINANDFIGIFLNDGSIQWTTVVSYTAGLAVLTDALTSTVNAGNVVYVYTSKVARPIKVVNSRYRASLTTKGIPTSKWNSTQYFESDYETATGSPSAWYYDPQLSNGVYRVNKNVTANTHFMRLTYVRPLEVSESNADEVDFPSEWFLPLTYFLALALLPQFPAPDQLSSEIKEQAQFYGSMVGMTPLGKLQPIPEAGRA